MMSRITLHLKRSAHKQELMGYRYEFSTNMTTAWRAGSQIQFADTGRDGNRTAHMSGMHNPFDISVEEQTVIMDDQGEVVQTLHKTLPALLPQVLRSPPRSSKAAPSEGHAEEWHEYAALRMSGDQWGRSDEVGRDRAFLWERR